jgi:hypothetical protein
MSNHKTVSSLTFFSAASPPVAAFAQAGVSTGFIPPVSQGRADDAADAGAASGAAAGFAVAAVGVIVRASTGGASSPAAFAMFEICDANEENWGAMAAGMLKLKQNEGPPPRAAPPCEEEEEDWAPGAVEMPPSPGAEGMKLKLNVKDAPLPALNDLLEVPLAFSPPAFPPLGADEADIPPANNTFDQPRT